MPKISVITSVYNDAAHLREALDSILGQTFVDFEWLIADDGSTDESPQILAEYAAKDARLKIWHQQNIGLTKTLNNLIKQASGEYIARMDSDDISLPDRLAAQVKFLDEHPAVGAVSCFAKVIDATGKAIGEHRPGTTHEQIKKLIFFSGQLCHPAVMFRKKAFVALGGYDETFRYAQDLDLWFKFIVKYQVANLPEFLFLWRKTAQGIGVAKLKAQRRFAQKAKWRALKSGLYPRYYLLFLVWPYLRGLAPVSLKESFKKIMTK